LEGAASGNESSTPSLSLTKDPLAPISTKQAGDFQAQIRGMIADRVGRQKNHLFRCYTTLIQKQKNASGKLDVHFTVNNLGKVEDPMIVKTEIMDKKFEKCLLQVIQRTDFQPFQGQKVSTFLPLRFEKNLNPIE
jgi:outer membrane biosynthesis protein TonB